MRKCVYTGCRRIRISSFIFVKQTTAYEMRISDWSSDVCSSDLLQLLRRQRARQVLRAAEQVGRADRLVRLLGVLGGGLVDARGVRQVLVAVLLGDQPAAAVDRLLGELHAVGSHIGAEADRLAVDVDAFIAPLGEARGVAGAET